MKKVKYFWKKTTVNDKYPGLCINIPVENIKKMEKLSEIEKLLREIGIDFDTGYSGSRDWEFDWSLSGEHYIFDEKKGKYLRIKR